MTSGSAAALSTFYGCPPLRPFGVTALIERLHSDEETIFTAISDSGTGPHDHSDFHCEPRGECRAPDPFARKAIGQSCASSSCLLALTAGYYRWMSIRTFIGIVGGLLIVGGVVFLSQPIKLADSVGQTVNCGNGFGDDDRAASEYSNHITQERFLGNVIVPPPCDSARTTRKMVAWPLAALGVITLLGAAVVKGPTRPQAA